jgi:hypothetical protein
MTTNHQQIPITMMISLFIVVGLLLSTTTISAVPCGTFFLNATSTLPTKGTCAQYKDFLEPNGEVGFCAKLVNYQYFLPAGKTQADLEILAATKLTDGNPDLPPGIGPLLVSLLPAKCGLQLKTVICASVFQPCDLVDPFYTDTTCGQGPAECQVCGVPANINGGGGMPYYPTLANTSPGYGSKCASSSFTKLCIAGPGKVPGWGNMGWERAATLVGKPVTQFCDEKNLIWSPTHKSCMVALPRSPCKSMCDLVNTFYIDPLDSIVIDSRYLPQSSLKVTCPVVTANASYLVTPLASSTDTYVKQQAQLVLQQANGSDIIRTFPLIRMLNLAPDCQQSNPSNPTYFTFSQNYTAEIVAYNRLASVGSLIKTRASTLSDQTKCHCVSNLLDDNLADTTTEYCSPNRTSSYCGTLASTTSQCYNNEQPSLDAAPLSGLAFTDDWIDHGLNPIAKKLLDGPYNQPDAEFLGVANLGYEGKMGGAFYMPASVGLPPLIGQGLKQPVNSKGQNLCSFPNVVTGATITGTNSPECVFAQVDGGADAVPGFFKGKCRAAFLDFVFSTAHMKLEFKKLCFNPDGKGGVSCGAADVFAYGAGQGLPFLFALPRFPSRELCQTVHTECKGFKDFLLKQAPEKLAQFNAAVDCNKNVTQTCKNNIDGWNSSIWACDSPFNSYPNYPPEGVPVKFLDVAQIFSSYLSHAGISLDKLQDWGTSLPAIASLTHEGQELLSSQELCKCPQPLLAPESPNDPTLVPEVCCQQNCLGHMFSQEDYRGWLVIHDILGSLSFVGALFVFATWATFKSKRSQGLTLWFGGVSLLISIGFLVEEHINGDPTLAQNKVWCQSNTVLTRQSHGGPCIFQAVWLTYFVLAACMLWFCQAIDLFFRIVQGKRHIDHYTKYYHAVSWSVPLIAVIIAGSLDAFGFKQNVPFCIFRDTPENPAIGKGVELGILFGIIMGITFFGSVVMVLVVRKIFEVTGRAHVAGNSKDTASAMAKKLVLYRTPMFFVFFFVYFWTSVFGWRFELESRLPFITEAGELWVQCLLGGYAAGIADPATDPTTDVSMLNRYGVVNGTGCGIQYPVKLTVGNILYIQVIIMSQGIFVFLIYGAKMDNINLWREKLRLTSKTYDNTGGSSAESSTRKASFAKFFSGKGSQNPSQMPTSQIVVGGGIEAESGKFLAVGDAQIAAYMDEEENARNELKI